MRILIVDDDAEVQRLMDKLEPRGVQIGGTPNADDAFRLWASNPTSRLAA
jgi:CheY-like chemotaxis protein